MKFEYLETKSNYMKEIVYQDLAFLKKSLHSGEELEGVSVGVFQENYGIYGLTSQRLIFCSVANGREIIKEYALSDIKEVKLARTGLYNLRLAVENSWYRLGITWLAAKEVHQYLESIIDLRNSQVA